MAQETKVVRNRVSIDGRIYDVRALGGGRFDIYNHNQLRVGGFAIVARELTAEDRGIADADPAEQIGLLWAKGNLSLPVEAKRPAPPEPAPEPPPAAPVIVEAPKPSEPGDPAREAREREAARRVEERQSIADGQEIARGPDGDASAHDLDAGMDQLVEGPIPLGKGIMRIATHDKPDLVALSKAQTFLAWLRKQPGVHAAYLSHDPKTGRTISVTLWENRDALANIRKASPPRNAVQLKSVTVELLWIVG